MNRKFYAFLLLVGTLIFFTLIYLYFFVFFVSTLNITTNIQNYSVELFSQRSGLKTSSECLENPCIIEDISPGTYTLTLTAKDHKNIVEVLDIPGVKNIELDVGFEKQARLTAIEADEIDLSIADRIQIKRDQARYYVYFDISDTEQITFEIENGQLVGSYRSDDRLYTILSTSLVEREEIYAEYISGGEKIFIKIGENAYILSENRQSLISVPIQIPVEYIKLGNTNTQFQIITEKGLFLFDSISNNLEYQYLFKDFIYTDGGLIGVIYEDEKQKKKNFDLSESGNLVVNYNQQTKERTILLSTSVDIQRIEKINGDIILTSNDSSYLLENY